MPETVYSKAIDAINERGWHQGDYEGPDGSVCLFGALAFVLSDQTNWQLVPTMDATPVQVKLAWHIDELFDGVYPDIWNDSPSTSEEDVLLALKHLHEEALNAT